MGDYRKLEVWELGCSLSDRVNELIERLPPRLRNKGDQLVRAADSIHENIAEGCGLNSDPQLARHLKIALGSANEVEDELATLGRRGHLKDKDWDLIPDARLLCAKIAKLIQRVAPGTLTSRVRPLSGQTSPAEPRADRRDTIAERREQS